MSGELSAGIRCQECLDHLERCFPGQTVFCRAFVETDVHALHRPMHQNEVGPAHRRRAKREYAEWEALSPYARAAEPSTGSEKR